MGTGLPKRSLVRIFLHFISKYINHSASASVRDVNVFFFKKTIVSLKKRRRKIKNEPIVYLKMVVFKTIVLKNDRF